MGAPKIPNRELTTFERAIIEFIADHKRRYGEAPSLKGMARHFNVYPNAIRYHLTNLVDKGHVQERPVRPQTGKFVLSAKGRSAAG